MNPYTCPRCGPGTLLSAYETCERRYIAKPQADGSMHLHSTGETTDGDADFVIYCGCGHTIGKLPKSAPIEYDPI